MKLRWVGLALLLAGATASAQQDQQPPAGAAAVAQPRTDQQTRQQMQQQEQRYAEEQERMRQRMQPVGQRQGPPPSPGQPPLERSLGGPPGKWWDNPEMAQRLALTSDQQKKMDDVFQQSRLKLIDLNAAIEKEEAIMEPLVSAEQPDEGKIVAQIDKVAQARAELEKANARMLLGIRRVLTQDQWNKLKAETANHPPQGGPPRRGPGGPPGR